MDLKEYRMMPDEGLFEQVERKVRRRRMARVAGIVCGGAMVIVVAIALIVSGQRSSTGGEQLAELVGERLAGSMEQGATTGYPLPVTDSPEGAGQMESVSSQQSTGSVETAVSQSDNQSLGQSNVLASEQLSDQTYMPSVSGTLNQPTTPMLPPAVTVLETTPVADLLLDDVGTQSEPASDPGRGNDLMVQNNNYTNILWAPNIITPMGDNADNRVFKVTASGSVSHFQLTVFNRGGRQVFSSNDINRSWDATRDGSQVPQGTYVWVARFRDSDGVLRQEKGTVTVVR